MTKVKLMDIVVDPTIQVREVENHTVSKYAQAMKAGAKFPPMLLESKTNRLVCGNHRYYAYKSAFGPEQEVAVEYKLFDNEADLIRHAASDNARHGRPLDTWDQKRIAIRLAGHGDSAEAIADVLAVPAAKVEQWAGMTVIVIGKQGKRKLKNVEPVKHGMEHMAGQPVEAQAYAEHERHDPGIPVKNMAAVITRHLTNGWIAANDPKTIDNLEALYTALGEFLKERVE